MEAVFLKFLNMSISASWLILAVVILRQVLKKAPKWIRCILWGIVALRLICPFSLESALSLIPSAETIPKEILYAKEPAIHSGVSFVNSVVNPVLSERLAPDVGDSVNPVQVLTVVASVLWILGIALLFLYALISYIRLRRKVAVSMCAVDNIYICDYIDTPFILGIIRPKIYLPSALEKCQVPYVISHERAHLKRRDHLWKPLGYMLLTVYWFNPLIWVAYILLCRDIELACDEKVIRQLGEADKKSYSEALLECSVSRRLIMACPLAFGEVGVKERVRTVLNYKRPAFWLIVAAIITCGIVAVCFLTNPKEKLLYWSDPFSHSYYIESTAYSSPQNLIYSSMVYPTNYARYSFTADGAMLCRHGVHEGDFGEDWGQLGSMQEVKLTKGNFDEYFREWAGISGLPGDFSAKEYRKENKKAWQLLLGVGEMSYYLLQQKNGDVYLALWYYDKERENDPESDDSEVRWMFKLERADYVTCNLLEAEKNSYFEPGWYHLGQLGVLQDEPPVVTVEAGGRLEFVVEGSPETLHVEEEFYDSQGSLIKTGDYTLVENKDGVYALDIVRTDEAQEAYALYYVTYAEGKYVFKLEFASERSVESQEPGNGTGTEEGAITEPVDPLEAAIHDVILGTDKERIVEGLLFPCESHVILGQETLCAYPKPDGTGGATYLTVYAMVLKQEYSFGYPNGEIIDGLGGHGPVAITFKVEGDEYILEEYWRPGDGAYYLPDIREKFPDDIEEEALDTQKYILAQIQDCYNQAVRFAGTDTDAVVEELMDTILFRPEGESSLQPYIDAHSLEYRELTYYGKYTLEYCAKQFEKGGYTELKGTLMAQVCQEIAQGWGEKWMTDYTFENAQSWYDGYGKEWFAMLLSQPNEETQVNWGLTLSASDVTPEGLKLICTQSGGELTGQLQAGVDYQLMSWQNDGWEQVPYVSEDIAWTAEAIPILAQDSTIFDINWTWVHGELPTGKYRIIKEIMDFRGSGDYDTAKYFVEFEIE